MGIINNDAMMLNSGLNLPGLLLTFEPPNTMMPAPITMSYNVNPGGDKTYFANAILYIFASQTAKDQGLTPIETRSISIPVDPSTVYEVLYSSLKEEYPNCVVIDADNSASGAETSSQPSEPPVDTSSAPSS